VKDPQELFLHELEDMYDAEQRILKVLPKLAKEAQDDKLREAFEHHHEETQTQVENLDKVFQLLGKKPETTTCKGVEGLEKEHESFLEEKPSPDILQLFDLGAAAKTEHYEICSYTDLIDMATLLGHNDAVPLLKENLKHEKEMAEKVEKLSKTISKTTIRELQPA
jgi:ferritin-like metal-binding protein YciE